MRRRLLAPLFLTLAAGAGCVQHETMPIALVDAEIVDDPEGAPRPYHGEYGTMTIVQLSPDSANWVNLGLKFSVAPTPTSPEAGPLLASAAQEFTIVQLQTAQPKPTLRGVAIPGGTYHFVRLVQMPWIRNTSSWHPGDAAPVSWATVSGTVGDTSVIVADARFAQSLDLLTDRRIDPLTLREGDRVKIAWDLNSDQWLTREALRTKRIDRALAAAAPSVRVTR